MLTRSKCASKFSISGMFQYYWIYFLVTFYFQDKKYQLEDHIKHFFFLCFQTLMTYSFILSIYQTDLMPIVSVLPLSPSHIHNPSATFLFSQTRLHVSVQIFPSCANLCKRSGNCWTSVFLQDIHFRWWCANWGAKATHNDWKTLIPPQSTQ